MRPPMLTIGTRTGVYRLRQQLLALHAQRPRRRLTAPCKMFWVALRTCWSGWRKPLVLVTPRAVRELASCGVSLVLGLGLKIQTSRRAEAYQQGGSRLDLRHGCRESDLGSSAHSRRTAQAGFRCLGEECLTMDPANSRRSRSCEAMANVPQKPSRGHCRDGLLHRPNAHVRCFVLACRLADYADSLLESVAGRGSIGVQSRHN